MSSVLTIDTGFRRFSVQRFVPRQCRQNFGGAAGQERCDGQAEGKPQLTAQARPSSFFALAHGTSGLVASRSLGHYWRSVGPKSPFMALLTRTFHTRVAADVSRRILFADKMAPTDVGGYTLSANRAECEISGLRSWPEHPG